MNERTKELAEQAGLKIEEDGEAWVFVTHKSFFEKFADLVREDERKRLNGVTAHEQMLIDGQQAISDDFDREYARYSNTPEYQAMSAKLKEKNT